MCVKCRDNMYLMAGLHEYLNVGITFSSLVATVIQETDEYEYIVTVERDWLKKDKNNLYWIAKIKYNEHIVSLLLQPVILVEHFINRWCKLIHLEYKKPSWKHMLATSYRKSVFNAGAICWFFIQTFFLPKK